LGLPVWLPPLRERDSDVLIIAKYFLNEFCKENRIGELRFSKKAQEKLLGYRYPGNVRELKSIVDLAAVLSDEDEIHEEDIKFSTLLDENKMTLQELTLKEYNIKIITHMLEKYDNNVIKVAKKLDIGKSTIYRYLKEMEGLIDQ
jgi:DNA-binding NtrC family response regulator